jgi:hypothetical protein
MNPRVTGASSMTNLAAFAHADAPLFLFHMLEFSGVPFDLDVEALNKRWSHPHNIDSWSQLVIKHTGTDIEPIRHAPPSGVWELDDGGGVTFVRDQVSRRTVRMPNRAFFLRIAKQGDWFYEGADLGILVTPGRLMTDGFRLTARAKAWAEGIQANYKAGRATASGSAEAARQAQVGGFKLL